MTKKQIKQYIIAIVALIVCVVGYLLADNYSKSKKMEAEEESSKAAETNGKVILEIEDTSVISGLSYQLEGETVKLFKSEDGNWESENDKSLKIDSNAVESLIVAELTTITGEKVETESEDISPYGFDAPTNTIVITKTDGTSDTLIIGSQNEFNTEKYYLMVEGDENVYVVDSAVPNAFSTALEDLEEETTTVEEDTSASDEETT